MGQQCPQGRQSALRKCLLGRPSTTKLLFHLSNVNINLLICPGAIKLSCPQGKKKSHCSFLISALAYCKPYQQTQAAFRARESRNGSSKVDLLSYTSVGIACSCCSWSHRAKSTKASPPHGVDVTHCCRVPAGPSALG